MTHTFRVFCNTIEIMFWFNCEYFQSFVFESFKLNLRRKKYKKIKSYEIEKLINKRQTKRRKSKYLIRWRNYEFENDNWKNIFELDDVINLIRKYEKIIRNIIFLSNRLKSYDEFFVFTIRKFISKTVIKSTKKIFFVVTIRFFFNCNKC